MKADCGLLLSKGYAPSRPIVIGVIPDSLEFKHNHFAMKAFMFSDA